MKNRFWLFVVVLVALIGLTMSFSERVSDNAPASYGVYEYTFTSDTITNTESDTLTLTPLFLSKWTYQYSFDIDSLSGTPSLTLAIQESNKRSGSQWVTVESGTVSSIGATTNYSFLNGDGTTNPDGMVRGVRQRVIITGVGTNSTKYSVKTTMKKY